MPIYPLKALILLCIISGTMAGAGPPQRRNCRTAADFAGLFTRR